MNLKAYIEDKALTPIKKYSTDAGIDLFIYNFDQELNHFGYYLHPHDTEIIDTGFHINIPNGYYGLVLPRSSTSAKGLLIHTGVIDSGYTGSIKIVATNLRNKAFYLSGNTRIAQLVIQKCKDIRLDICKEEDFYSNDTISNRGDNGFGSTGTN